MPRDEVRDKRPQSYHQPESLTIYRVNESVLRSANQSYESHSYRQHCLGGVQAYRTRDSQKDCRRARGAQEKRGRGRKKDLN
jgi:hypothetical protein